MEMFKGIEHLSSLLSFGIFLNNSQGTKALKHVFTCKARYSHAVMCENRAGK
jgi:hypothetical protein